MEKKKKKSLFVAICMMVLMLFSLTGCASCSRGCVDLKSELSGGLQRTITVYTADGEVIATYEGKIDIEANEGGYVKFDFNGKRYIYYNCFVESIADIN